MNMVPGGGMWWKRQTNDLIKHVAMLRRPMFRRSRGTYIRRVRSDAAALQSDRVDYHRINKNGLYGMVM